MLRLITLSASSKGNCHVLECDNSSIMLDCGIKAKDIVDNIDYSKLDGVFVTHVHKDHSKGVEELSVYTNCNYYMNHETFENTQINGMRYKKEINGIIDTKDFKILPFDVYHDVQNTNFLILYKKTNQKFLYITDTSNVSNLHFKDIDFFIVEGNFSKSWDLDDTKYKRTNSSVGHLPIEETREFLEKNISEKTKCVFITHISHSFKNIYQFENYLKETMPSNIKIKALENRIIGKQIYNLEEE